MLIPIKSKQDTLKLTSFERYKYTIEQIVAWNEVWSLFDEDWTVLSDNGNFCFPIWPAREYAKLCAQGDWKSYAPKSIELAEFFDETIPWLVEQDTLLSVFVTPTDPGYIPDYEAFSNQVLEELTRVYGKDILSNDE